MGGGVRQDTHACMHACPGRQALAPSNARTHAGTYVGDVGGDEGEGDERAAQEGLGERPEEVDGLGEAGGAVALEHRRALLGDVGVVGQLDGVVADAAHDGEDEGELPDAGVLVGEKEGVVLPLVVDEELLRDVDAEGGVAEVREEGHFEEGAQHVLPVRGVPDGGHPEELEHAVGPPELEKDGEGVEVDGHEEVREGGEGGRHPEALEDDGVARPVVLEEEEAEVDALEKVGDRGQGGDAREARDGAQVDAEVRHGLGD